jgi:hypothetical protein
MTMIRLSRLTALFVAFSAATPWSARADAPDAGKFLICAFSDEMGNGSEIDITAVHGSHVFLIVIVGGGAISHERVRSPMQSGISH